MAAFGFLSGCASYASSYTPPADGRARAVFVDKHVEFSVSRIWPPCAVPDEELAASPGGPGGVAWTVWTPGVFVGPPPPPRLLVPPPLPVARSTRMGAGTGGFGDSKQMLILAVAAIVAAPIVAYSLALSRPEPEDEVVEVVDRVNAYNDEARLHRTPCSPVQ